MLHAIFILALAAADDKEAADAIERFNAAYKNNSPAARAAAIAELGKTPHEKTMKKIIPFLTADVNTVRIAAAKALTGYTDYKKQVTPFLIAALPPNQKEIDVLKEIYLALGKVGDDSAMGSIHKTFEDKDANVTRAGLAAAGEFRNVGSIDLIIELMKKLQKWQKSGGDTSGTGLPGGGDDPRKKYADAVLPDAIKAMQAISKEKWSTAEEWGIWWGKRKATYKIEK